MSSLADDLRQQKTAAKPELRTQLLKEWLAILDAFFKQIDSWLADAKKEGLIVEFQKDQVSEPALGSYQAPFLLLTFDTGTILKKVTIKPIGRVVIGANGRVDMHCRWGTYIFTYHDDKKKWLYPAGMDEDKVTPVLTQKLFEQLLQRALRDSD